jgi:DNA-binding transcriptional MerR regulator
MFRLQEIIFYRDAGLSLTDIDHVLQSPVKALDRLIRHRDELHAQARRAADVIALLDETIAHLKGEKDMALEELYKPFSAEKQAEYEQWLIDTYGQDMAAAIRTSKVAAGKEPSGMEGATEELRKIEAAIVTLFEEGLDPTSRDCHDALEKHRALMARFWGKPCGPDGFAGLADLYTSHPDFVARYEALSPQFSNWLPVAMKSHAARLRSSSTDR